MSDGRAHALSNDGRLRIDPAPASAVARPKGAAYGRLMGFLDKLFGRAKDTAGDVADSAAPVVDKVEDAVSDVMHRDDDAPSPSGEVTAPEPGTSGSTPPAA